MAEKYQTCAKKSTKKFGVLGRKELAVGVPLPLVEDKSSFVRFLYHA